MKSINMVLVVVCFGAARCAVQKVRPDPPPAARSEVAAVPGNDPQPEVVLVSDGLPANVAALADCEVTSAEIEGLTLPVTVDACPGPVRACVQALAAASCPMRPRPPAFTPPEIHCQGTPVESDEGPPPPEGWSGDSARKRLAACLPACSHTFRILQKTYDDAYADWLSATEERRRFCDEAR